MGQFFGEVVELDFNPVLVYPDGCVAVDARMVLA
jgi:ATP-grasp domain